MIKKLLVLLVLLVPFGVNAAGCDVTARAELLNEAKEITANFIENSYILEEADGDYNVPYFDITFLNVSENFYVEITNNQNDNIVTLNYSDMIESNLFFEHRNLSKVTLYSYSIFGSSSSDCSGEKLSSGSLLVPMLNNFSSRDVCLGYPDEAICARYTTNDAMDESYFLKQIDSLNDDTDAEREEEEAEANKSFLEKNLIYIIIGVVGLGIIGGSTYVIIRNKRSKIV